MRDLAAHDSAGSSQVGLFARVKQWLIFRKYFFLIVIVPTVFVAIYYFLIVSNQYESDAHFMVRSAQGATPTASSGLTQVLSLAGGGGQSEPEAASVGDYLNSHDAVAALRKNDDLVERFRPPGVDPLSRLGSSNPSAENLLKYYRKHVDVELASDTGITTLRVRAFRPEDSYVIINALLKLGEERVNDLNARLYRDTVAAANRQLADAEADVAHTQLQMTSFRQSNHDIDPTGSGEAQIRLVSDLTASLSAARAQLAAMNGTIAPSSPQYVASVARVRALEAQVAAQSTRMANDTGGKTIATDLGGYEALRVQQDFAAKQYVAAAAALQEARDKAMNQQMFIVRVVEPNVPEKSTYPTRLTNTVTIFFGLLLAYGIGWLIAAGVREHAA